MTSGVLCGASYRGEHHVRVVPARGRDYAPAQACAPEDHGDERTGDGEPGIHNVGEVIERKVEWNTMIPARTHSRIAGVELSM